jgi:HSP20 family molecular chaperone IbpA
MLMRSWQPFTEIETIRQQLDKVFDQLAATRDNSEATWMPALELVDAGDNFVLKAQLPGIDPKDLTFKSLAKQFLSLASAATKTQTKNLATSALNSAMANSTGCFPCRHTFKTTLCKLNTKMAF